MVDFLIMKSTVRERFVNLTRTFIGFIYVLFGKPFLQRGLTVFVFHEVNDNPRLHARETNTYSDVGLFQRQIEWIKENFSIIDSGIVKGTTPLQGCLVTFDDGYRGVLSNALPILEHYQVPAVCFVNMVTIQGEINSSAMAMYMAKRDQKGVLWTNSNPHFFNQALERLSANEIDEVREYQGPYMNEQELELLSQSPLIIIGDHLNNHWHMSSFGVDALDIEIVTGRSKLQNFTWDGRFFAAPHGVVSSQAIESLERAGYSYIFSGRFARTTSESSRVYPRIDMNSRIQTQFQLFGTIVISKLRTIRFSKVLKK